ncbi:hypothetical protein PCCS19_02130 [Paenibacillus sp. CCS19]|uniref:hypothetical protein n=1 Tax=Paenibacillus sp. CCS19 TaxID=3158387 RepID=UPI00256410FD|nr:hypothetical protein [Paenibacillus cellulosilyticus]GMK37160.1 hypothetical protein PCCS19_02130 [Paenibacillus cellulosilyticus]
MRQPLRRVAFVFLLAIVAILMYDYFTTSRSEAIQIAERYNAAESFRWKVGEAISEKGNWVIQLTPVEQLKEAEWLYIDKFSGRINKIEATE